MNGNSVKTKNLLRVFLAFVLVLITSFPTKSFAGTYDMPNGAVSNDAHETMISVTSKNVENYGAISNWLSVQRTYIFMRNIDGNVSHYFNTPNIQRSIMNTLQEVNPGGWLSSSYDNSNNEYKEESDWTTASKKYGYSVPYAVYIGETPVTTINLTGITSEAFAPLNVVRVVFSSAIENIWKAGHWVAGLFGFNFPEGNGTEFTAGLSEDTIKGIEYANSDYSNTSQEYVDKLADWVKKYWSTWAADKDNAGAKINDKNIFDDGVVVSDSELKDIDARALLGKLIDKSGSSYDGIIESLNSYNKDKGYEAAPVKQVVRNMPYELDTMSPASKEYMNNISDPRVEMFNTTGPLGTIGSAMSQVSYAILGYSALVLTANIAHLGAVLNSICDLKLLTSNGFSFSQFWEGSIGEFLLLATLIAAIFFMVTSAIKSFTNGSVGSSKIISKAIMTALMAFLAVGLLANPKQVGDVLVNTTSRILSIGTVVMNNNDAFNQLYTSDASDADKSELRYWYMYHSVWTEYVTNHNVADEANKFDVSSGLNEYVNLDGSPAKLSGGSRINLWSVALLDAQQKDDKNFYYRVSDHFLAPTITDGRYPSFEVSRNKYYNGFMFSETPFGGIFVSLAVLMMTALKLFCFIELVTDILLLFIKFVLGAFEGSAFILNALKSIGNDITRVIIYDVFITMFIWSSVKVASFGLVIISILELSFVVFLVKYLIDHNSHIMCPGTLVMLEAGITRAVNVVSHSGEFSKVNKEADDRNNEVEEIEKKRKDFKDNAEDSPANNRKVNDYSENPTPDDGNTNIGSEKARQDIKIDSDDGYSDNGDDEYDVEQNSDNYSNDNFSQTSSNQQYDSPSRHNEITIDNIKPVEQKFEQKSDNIVPDNVKRDYSNIKVKGDSNE